jgi:hypothetical protein
MPEDRSIIGSETSGQLQASSQAKLRRVLVRMLPGESHAGMVRTVS